MPAPSLLGLAALASDREVVISRGQLVEIGGSFRIPDVMARAAPASSRWAPPTAPTSPTTQPRSPPRPPPSCASTPATSASSALPSRRPSATSPALAHERNILLLDDLGSGSLFDTTQFGLGKEPTVQESLTAGADLVFFSGDKLLGGPQAGIIGGRRDLVDKLKRHPLARALRLDKMTIAALTATLTHYVKDEALQKIPVWRMISLPVAAMSAALPAGQSLGEPARIVDGRSMIGGGSLPEESLPTKLLALGATPSTW